jgi:hypothetical protein
MKKNLWNRLTMHKGVCHSHVQLEVLHFAELSFWSNYSKLEEQQNSLYSAKS